MSGTVPDPHLQPGSTWYNRKDAIRIAWYPEFFTLILAGIIPTEIQNPPKPTNIAISFEYPG